MNELTKGFMEESAFPEPSVFLRNRFEYQLYNEFKKQDWYFGGFIRFSYFFRQFILFIPKNKPESFNELKEVMRYVENGFSITEIIFFTETIQKFILWNLETNFQHLNLYIPSYRLSTDTSENLMIFYYQLELFKKFLNKKLTVDHKENESQILHKNEFENLVNQVVNKENNEEELQNSLQEEQQLEEELMSSKVETAKKIIAFFNGRHPNTKERYMTVENFKILEEYTEELIRKGVWLPHDKTIPHIFNFDQQSIFHTYYLINKHIHGRKRLPHFFTFLTSVFEDLKDYEQEVKKDFRTSYIYKHYKDHSKFYPQYNPDWFTPKEVKKK